MPYIIGLIIVIALLNFLIKKVLPSLFGTITRIFTFLFKYVIYGPGTCISKLLLKIFDKIRLKGLFILLSYCCLMYFSNYVTLLNYGDDIEWASIVWNVSSILFFVYYISYLHNLRKQNKYKAIIDFYNDNMNRCQTMLSSVFYLAEGLLLSVKFLNPFFYYYFALSTIIYLLVKLILDANNSRFAKNFSNAIADKSYFDFDSICKHLSVPKEKLDLCRRELLKNIYDNKIVELFLGTTNYYFNKNFFLKLKGDILSTFSENARIEKFAFLKAIKSQLDLPEPLLADFMNFYMESINLYEFDDGEYYLSDLHIDEIIQCTCCGKAILLSEGQEFEGEYFCSDICLETEELCMKIIQMPKYVEAKSEIKTSDSSIVAGAAAWGTGQYWIEQIKVVSPNTQGHGFAAEQANTVIDKFKFKNAQVVGGDNVADGADRLVDGQLIQSKYCQTAYKSVHEAFSRKGEAVPYRYMDQDTGKPMQLEVPKEQYELAVKEMEKRISNGEVPGVTDPAEAKNIMRKGNITYKQAQNITKFGTVESLAYDAVHGIVFASSAAGISFVISTAITYWKTKDVNLAVKASFVQGLKTGGKVFAVYIVGAQLQRIQAVTNFLDSVIKINFTNSSSGKYIAQQLAGKSATGQVYTGKQLNKRANTAVKGAVAAATAAVAVQSTIEIVRMARGRISGMQCVKNITVAATSVVAGTVGSMVGGVLLSPIPVVGPVVGSIVFGALAGTFASKGVKKIIDVFIKDDSEKMLGLITRYIEYIAVQFYLSEEELKILATELDEYISENSTVFEDIFASTNRRSKINSFIKPMVVNIVRHRDEIEYEIFDEDNIVKAISA